MFAARRRMPGSGPTRSSIFTNCRKMARASSSRTRRSAPDRRDRAGRGYPGGRAFLRLVRPGDAACLLTLRRKRTGTALAAICSVRTVGMRLVVGDDRLLRELPSLPGSKPARMAQSLTSLVLACHCEPAISSRGPQLRAMRMASATSSAERRVRLMASSANTAWVSSWERDRSATFVRHEDAVSEVAELPEQQRPGHRLGELQP